MGLTLFGRDANGLSVRVDPSRVFRSGERVRVLVETNTDGHLYIFNTTDGGKPLMIYPNAELDEGGNYIQAHVPLKFLRVPRLQSVCAGLPLIKMKVTNVSILFLHASRCH